MLRNVSSGTAILLFALVNVTTLPTTVKAQGLNVECKAAVLWFCASEPGDRS